MVHSLIEGSSLATLCVFAAQESIRLGAEIDLDQFQRSLLIPDEGTGEGMDGAESGQAESPDRANPALAGPEEADAPAGHG